MSSLADHNSWETGSDVTCASLGNTGMWKCGFILQEGVNSDQTVKVGMTAIPGDSGSGMRWGNRIDGILNGITTNAIFFQTGERAETALAPNFSFNCHVGLLTTTNPAAWGTCPQVNA
jgi:hypothetical protein